MPGSVDASLPGKAHGWPDALRTAAVMTTLTPGGYEGSSASVTKASIDAKQAGVPPAVAALGRALGLDGGTVPLGEQPAMRTAATTAAPVLIKAGGLPADLEPRWLGDACAGAAAS